MRAAANTDTRFGKQGKQHRGVSFTTPSSVVYSVNQAEVEAGFIAAGLHF
jgi:hypothetical protein